MSRPGLYISDENLAERFPISPRYIVRQSFWWIIGLVGLSWAVLYFVVSNDPANDPDLAWLQQFYDAAFLVLFVVAVIAAARILYAYLYRLTYFYGIEGRHFVISRGVILKERRTCPINHITDVLIGRSFRDFIFRLNFLEVRTPAMDSQHTGRIEGLSEETALALQNYLLEILEAPEDGSHMEGSPFTNQLLHGRMSQPSGRGGFSAFDRSAEAGPFRS